MAAFRLSRAKPPSWYLVGWQMWWKGYLDIYVAIMALIAMLCMARTSNILVLPYTFPWA